MTIMITIVVPAFNIEDVVGECLRSIIAQTECDWQCLCVDDGSTDATRRRALECADPRIKVLTQPNSGVSAARNLGLREATGEVVMFLDGDDLLHPTALARLHACLVEMPAAVAAFGSFRKILFDGSPYPGEKPLSRHRYPSGDVLDAMLRGNFLANGGHILIRTEAVRRAGGFDDGLRLSEDWEFWCRLALHGPFVQVAREPECLRLRVAPTSASGGLSQDWAAHQPAIEAVLGNRAIRARYDAAAWRRLEGDVRATHLWEAARVNFTLRRFKAARNMMLDVLRRRPTAKRWAQFGLAEVASRINRPILSRYRWRDLDIRTADRDPASS